VGSGELRPKRIGHFVRLRKTTDLLLREDDLVVQRNVKHAAVPFDQLGRKAEFALDFVRQTGGSRKIAS
jgi:tRNA splicing ligase